MRTHYVVLDTNALIDTWGLSSDVLGVLQELAPLLRIRLAVPQVVVDEFEAHVKRDFEVLAREQNRLNKELRRWGAPRGGQPTVDVEGGLARFMDATRERLRRFEVEILPRPVISVEALLKRAMGKVPPFSAGGAGLPDTMIWLTTLALLNERKEARVTFVTNDGDFFTRRGGETSLLPSLVSEAAAQERLEHCPKLWDFVDGIKEAKLSAQEIEALSWLSTDHEVLRGVLDALRASTELTRWTSVTVKQVVVQQAIRTPRETVVAVDGSATVAALVPGLGSLVSSVAEGLFGGVFDGDGGSVEHAQVEFTAHLLLSHEGAVVKTLRAVECSRVNVLHPAANGTLAARVLAAAASVDP